MTKTEMATILGALRLAYPAAGVGKDDLPVMAKLWLSDLRDFSDDVIRRSVKRAMRGSTQFFPSLPSVRAVAVDEAKTEKARAAIPVVITDPRRQLGEDKVEMSTMTREEQKQKLRDIMKEAGLS